jgi:hypothetical protein
MLIEELLGYTLNFEDEDAPVDTQLRQAIDDLLLRMRKSGTTEISLGNFARELDKDVDDIKFDARDPELRNILITRLQESDWVKEVTNDKIVIKTEADTQPVNDPGAEIKATRQKQLDKVSKDAMANVRKQSSGETL